jgi:hypothetical protein
MAFLGSIFDPEICHTDESLFSPVITPDKWDNALSLLNISRTTILLFDKIPAAEKAP